MGDFYAKMKDKGMDILLKRGMDMTLRRTTQGAYNPATGTTGTATVANYTCRGFISNIDSAAANQFYSTGELQNTLIEKEDQIVVISSLIYNAVTGSLTPITPDTIRDSMIINGVNYSLIAVIPLQPAGIPVLFSIQVRR